MLVVSLKNVPPNCERVLLPYLYKVRTNLYCGDVTKRVLEYILLELPRHTGSGNAILLWKNAKAPCGFELFEITGDANSLALDFDGILLMKNSAKS